jgi:ribosomal protein S20
VEAGDAGRADQELAALVSRIDKAVKSGALHGNNAARKKARAARIRARI